MSHSHGFTSFFLSERVVMHLRVCIRQPASMVTDEMLFAVTVHRLCGPGACHAAGRAGEIPRGVAKTLQRSVST